MFHFFGLHVYLQQTVRSWGDSTAASLGTQGFPWMDDHGETTMVFTMAHSHGKKITIFNR